MNCIIRTFGLLVALLVAPTVAFAQEDSKTVPSDEAKVEASAHFRRGVEFFQEEAFRAALAEFQRAYEIAPDYRLLYNIGQTKLEVHDYLGAAQSYERYLAAGYLDIAPERRSEVEEALTALRERVASIKIVVNHKDAEVFIDDVKVGTSPIEAAVLVNVGSHRVMAKASYGSTDTEVVDVAGGDTASVTLELAAPVPLVVVKDARKPFNTAERAAIATWSAAGAVAVGALVTGLLAEKAQKDLDKLLATRDVTRKAISDKHDSAHTMAITTDVLIGTAAAAAVAGTLTWLLGHEKDGERKPDAKRAAAQMRLDVGLGSLGVRGRF